ncbi:hypothetical protein B4113_4080 [Geobacillus sp. B4113_201601]|nr:hypothetical protein B4113_4080 [Geobacillus sp. B4113_201601]
MDSSVSAASLCFSSPGFSLAQMAIEQLDKENMLELDDERKAAMVNNLMVAIVSERTTQPVINTGSLY